jgi:hypothetical protein
MPVAAIATTQAVFALEKLHAELGGKIKDNKREAKHLAKCMKHVEAVLKMLEPGYSVRSISVRRRVPNPWFRRGTVYRAALDVLRAAPSPMTATEVAEAMLAAKGITDAPARKVSNLGQGVMASFRNHKDSTVVTVGEGTPARWTLVRL